MGLTDVTPETPAAVRREPQRLSDEAWAALDRVTGKTTPRGRVISLDEYRNL